MACRIETLLAPVWFLNSQSFICHLLFFIGCSFTVLVHTRDAATRNMEKVQVIKVRFENAADLHINSLCLTFNAEQLLNFLVWFSAQDFPWIVADEQEVHMQEPRLIPLKTMTSDIVKVSRNIRLTNEFIYSKTKKNIDTMSIWSLFKICWLIYLFFLSFTDAALRGRKSTENLVNTFQKAMFFLLLHEPICDGVASWAKYITQPIRHQSERNMRCCWSRRKRCGMCLWGLCVMLQL